MLLPPGIELELLGCAGVGRLLTGGTLFGVGIGGNPGHVGITGLLLFTGGCWFMGGAGIGGIALPPKLGIPGGGIRGAAGGVLFRPGAMGLFIPGRGKGGMPGMLGGVIIGGNPGGMATGAGLGMFGCCIIGGAIIGGIMGGMKLLAGGI